MKIKYLIAVVIGLLIATGIGLLVVENQPQATGQAVKEVNEPVKIGIIVYPGFAPFFIAEEKGFFEKHGVNADVVVINDPSQAISALASNNVQIMFSSADFTPIVKDAGVDIKEILASDIGYGSDGLLVKNDVNTIRDLKDKTVHLMFGTPSHFLFRVLTKEAGLSKEDVNLVDMPADQVGTAFIAGQIDYGMSWEPWLSKASEREDGKLLFSSRNRPGIITDTFIVRTDILQSRRSDVKAIARAWFDAVEFWENNPNEANAIMARNMGLNAEDFEAQVATIKFLDCNENLEKFDKSSNLNLFYLTEKAVEIFREDGIINSEVNPEGIIDATLLREVCYR